jgi:hypothetical protein
MRTSFLYSRPCNPLSLFPFCLACHSAKGGLASTSPSRQLRTGRSYDLLRRRKGTWYKYMDKQWLSLRLKLAQEIDLKWLISCWSSRSAVLSLSISLQWVSKLRNKESCLFMHIMLN